MVKTLGDAVSLRRTDETNNFTLLRLIGASLVVYGHSYALSGYVNGGGPIHWIDPNFKANTLGLLMFFVISGFLVTASFDRSASITEFAKKRALRIIPALAVCCLITTLVVGPAVTTLEIGQYFTSSETWKYLLGNTTTWHYVGELPGVTMTTGKFAKAIDGSLWTIPVEARLYAVCCVVMALSAKRKALATALILALGALAFAGWFPAIEPTGMQAVLIGCFGAGSLLYLHRDAVPLSGSMIAAIVLLAAYSYGTSAFYATTVICVVYATIYFAYCKKVPIKLPGDYSYGIYIYAFLVQQLTMHHFPNFGPHKLFAFAYLVALILAILSWHFIEEPALRLKNWKSALERKNIESQAA